jgi:GntR family transcriptional regulator
VPIQPPQARYQQLATTIREAIERGDYPPGSTLESETELGARYGVARHTVNRAMTLLRAEGLVRVERGNRTVVRELPILRRDAVGRQRIREQGDARGAFQAELARLGIEAHSNVAISEQIAPDDIAELLGIDPAAPALVRRRHMLADHIPVQLATSWLPMDIAAGTQLAEVDTGPGGIYSRLADLGHAPAEFTETVRLRLPDPDERVFLRMDGEQRVYAIRRTAADDHGRIVEVNDIVLPAHQWELVYSWPATTD